MERKIYDQIIHNAQMKRYPDGSATLIVSDRAIFREPGWEAVQKEVKGSTDDIGGKRGDPVELLERSRRRARAMVADYARSNDFEYFVTLTLDADKINRYDIKPVIKRLRTYLDNAVRRKGLYYILIPEFHQDGAVHFHGLINGVLPMVDSGTVRLKGQKKPRKPRGKAERQQWLDKGGQVVYNIIGYQLGFSTAIRLYGDYNAAIAYVCKYIGKGVQKIGGRWYYSGGDLKLPEKQYFDMDYEACRDGEHVFTIPRLGAECVKIDFEG